MTDKEFLTKACADIETRNIFLKKEIYKTEKEIKKLREEVAHLKKTNGLKCSL
jgi:hypothetical protein